MRAMVDVRYLARAAAVVLVGVLGALSIGPAAPTRAG